MDCNNVYTSVNVDTTDCGLESGDPLPVVVTPFPERSRGGKSRDPSANQTRLAAWAFSVLFHAATLAGLSVVVPRLPEGAAHQASGSGGIVLVARMSGGGEHAQSEHSSPPTVTLIPVEAQAVPNRLQERVVQPAIFQNEVDIGERALVDVVLASAALAVAKPIRPEVENRGEAPGLGAGQAPVAETRVFGVKGRGSRFVYVFDRSSSMEGAALAAAKRELLASLQSLQSTHQFQIIFYNQQPQMMPVFRGRLSRLVSADEQGKRQAANFIGGIFADGSTDHVQALAMALQLQPDVIFLLTDASEPQLRPDELLYVQRLNRGTSINTIEFGIGPPQLGFNFLQRLAAENQGGHTYVDIAALAR